MNGIALKLSYLSSFPARFGVVYPDLSPPYRSSPSPTLRRILRQLTSVAIMISIVLVFLLLAPAAMRAASYKIFRDYSENDFLSAWDFYGDYDNSTFGKFPGLGRRWFFLIQALR